MEILFDKKTCPCLNKLVHRLQEQEQTQEVRLPEAMPDIGRVLGCWGQVLIRGKEWRGGSMSVSGGVMAWALYAPEDGSAPRSMETWIPFQIKWDLPDTQRDGTICVVPSLKGIDARSTSARKLMIRANVSLMGQAMEPVEPEVCCPGQIPEDVQLLTKSYPVELPVESGEKLFQLEEELNLPQNAEKILRCQLTPEVTEQKVMAGRVVFRGKALLQLMYSDPEGSIHTYEQELPFSQYTELDRDHGANATAWIAVILTGLETEKPEEQKLSVKASMAAQYVIYDRRMLEVTQDAYSPLRSVQLQTQELILPVRLDSQHRQLQMKQSVPLQGGRILDVCCCAEQPNCHQNDDMAELAVPGQFQVLYMDEEGNMQSMTARAEAVWELSSDADNRIDGCTYADPQPQAAFTADTLELTASPSVDIDVFSRQGITMVTGLALGEVTQPDPGRPALILRRAGDGGLWQIAKDCGSTVDAICKANQLTGEPESGKMLLIPVS